MKMIYFVQLSLFFLLWFNRFSAAAKTMAEVNLGSSNNFFCLFIMMFLWLELE